MTVGAAIPAARAAASGDTLTYSMEGTDAASFNFDASTRQITTKAGVTYDFETKSSYSVTIKVEDGKGGTDTVAVTIDLTDVDDLPLAPAAPRVAATAGSATSLSVSWAAPANDGKAITSYDLRYRTAGSSGNVINGPQDVTGTSAAIKSLEPVTSDEVRLGANNVDGPGPWIDGPQGVTGTRATIKNLLPGTTYEVQVAANNAYGRGPWSDPPIKGSTRPPSAGATDLMAKAWIARFGRTVAGQVVSAVQSHLAAAPPGSQGAVSLAGQALPRWNAGGRNATGTDAAAARRTAEEARDRRAAFSHGLSGSEEEGQDGKQPEQRMRAVTRRDLLTGTSFSLAKATANGGAGALWGRGAIWSLNGRDGALSLNGEVASAMLGGTSIGGASTFGLLAAHSRGFGKYGSGEDGIGGKVSSTVTGLYPYVGYHLTPQFGVWAVAGIGAGSLTLEPKDETALKTDMDLAMAAVGLRGVAVEAGKDGGVELAVKMDAMGVRTTSQAANGGDGGKLAAAEAEVTRLRLGLATIWRGLEARGGELTPRLEFGVRHDGGEAETGFGIDIGGGLTWLEPKRGIAVEVSARSLMTHRGGDLRDKGISGSLSWKPRQGSDRGPSLTLTQTLGGSSTGGMDSLLGPETPTGLAADDGDEDEDELQRRRLALGLGYSFPAFGDRFTSTPELGLGLSNGRRDYRLGWRLGLGSGGGTLFDLGLQATRLEHTNDNDDAEHAIGFRLSAQW